MVWAYTGTAEKFEANLQGVVLPALMDSAALDNEIKVSVESPGQHRKAMPLPTFIRKTKHVSTPEHSCYEKYTHCEVLRRIFISVKGMAIQFKG